MDNANQTQAPNPDLPTTLYVVFHGEIVFIDDEVPTHRILAMAPAIDGHIFQAGPWMGELKIDQNSRLELKGVRAGFAIMFDDPGHTVNFDNIPGNPNVRPYFAVLLPRPNVIKPGLVLKLKDGLLKNPTPDGVSIMGPTGPGDTDEPTGMDIHPVFQYTIDPQGDNPGLQPPKGDGPGFDAGKGPATFSAIHIWAEEDRPNSGALHLINAFQAVQNLMGTAFVLNPEKQGEDRERLGTIEGLEPAEFTMPLAVRNSIVRKIGESHKLGDSPDLSQMFHEASDYPEQGPFVWGDTLFVPGDNMAAPCVVEGTCGRFGGRMKPATMAALLWSLGFSPESETH